MRRQLLVLVSGLVFTLVLGLAAAPAEAAPSAKDKAEAKALVGKAKSASAQKRWADAEEALRKADELDPNPQTKLDLARALVQQKELVEASQVLNTIGSSPAQSAPAKKVAAAAKKLLAEVEPRVPWVQVSVIGPSDEQATTTIDGKEVDAASEIPFDPGEHVVAAEAHGFEKVEKTIQLEEGEHEKVKLKLKKAAPEAKKDAPAASEDESGGMSVVPAALAFGVGAAGIAVGAIFGVLAFDQTSNVEARCDGNRCPPEAAMGSTRRRPTGPSPTSGSSSAGWVWPPGSSSSSSARRAATTRPRRPRPRSPRRKRLPGSRRGSARARSA